jgi:hypothetical protein
VRRDHDGSATQRPNKKRRTIVPDDAEERCAADGMEVEGSGAATTTGGGGASARFMEGLRFYLHLVGAEFDSIRATIKRGGGQVSSRFGSQTTHVLTSLPGASDEVWASPTFLGSIGVANWCVTCVQALRVAREINPDVLLVTTEWLRKCVLRSRLLSPNAA